MTAIAHVNEGRSCGSPREFDVVIVGGGIAGSAAAAVLGRTGVRVALVDLHETFPPDFRADKVAGDQIELARRLGFFPGLVANSARTGSVVNIRRGRVVDRASTEEYNLPYEDLVDAVRREIPDDVVRLIGRVTHIDASGDMQRIALSGGMHLAARLVVLATGHGEALRAKLGIRRQVLRKNHSTTIGFDLKPKGRGPFGFEALTSYGDKPSDRIDYISLFPFRRGLRANLFVYREPDDPWIKSFCAQPADALLETLPALAPHLGAFEVVGKVQMRPVDLYEVDGAKRDGVVLVGDAFKSGCPGVGHGLSRAFTDVDRLCNVHIPAWLKTEGMSEAKLASYYADPVKEACDAWSMAKAFSFRKVTLERGIYWRAQRLARFLAWFGEGNLRRLRHARTRSVSPAQSAASSLSSSA